MGFVPRAVLCLWDLSLVLCSQWRGEVRWLPALGPLSPPNPGHGIDTDSDGGTSGALASLSPASLGQGRSAAASEISLAEPHVLLLGAGTPAAAPPWSLDPLMSLRECGPVSRSLRRSICWASCSISGSLSPHVLGSAGALGDGGEAEVWRGPATRPRPLSCVFLADPFSPHRPPPLRQASRCPSSHLALGGGRPRH